MSKTTHILIEADYGESENSKILVTKRSILTEAEVVLILPILQEILSFTKDKMANNLRVHNYLTGDFARRFEPTAKFLYGKYEGFRLFDSLVPTGINGIHTITSIELLEVTAFSKFL